MTDPIEAEEIAEFPVGTTTSSITQDAAFVDSAIEKHEELMSAQPSYTHVTTNEFGNVMANVKVKLSDGTIATSNSGGFVQVPYGLTIVKQGV